YPGTAACRPVASSSVMTPSSMTRNACAFWASMTRWVDGAGTGWAVPSGPMIRRTRCGCTQTPSLAMAAYTEAIWIAVTATPLPIGTEPGSVPVHLSAGSTSPGASPRRPSPVGAPRPNLCWYSTTLSLPSRSAILIVPTFEDSARMPGIVIGVSVFCGWLSWYETPPLTTFGLTTIVESGLMRPSCRAAPTMIALWIDPGSKTVWVQLSSHADLSNLNGSAASYPG